MSAPEVAPQRTRSDELADAFRMFAQCEPGPFLRIGDDLEMAQFRRDATKEAFEAVRAEVSLSENAGINRGQLAEKVEDAFILGLFNSNAMAKAGFFGDERIEVAQQLNLNSTHWQSDFNECISRAISHPLPPQKRPVIRNEVIRATQAEVDKATLNLANRFGFGAVGLAENGLTCDRRMKFIRDTEKALTHCCESLGIKESSYGQQGSGRLSIENPQRLRMSKYAAEFHPSDWPDFTIRINPVTTDLSMNLTHEFTHWFDWQLGNKALRLFMSQQPDGTEPPMNSGAAYFSKMPKKYQILIPEAEKSISKIFGLLSNDPARETDQSEAARLKLYEQASIKLADRLMMKTLKPMGVFKLNPAHFFRARQALIKDTDFLDVLINSSPDCMPVHAFGHAIARIAPDRHQFFIEMEKAGFENIELKMLAALPKCREALASAAALKHGAARGSGPSAFIAKAIRKDMEKIASAEESSAYIANIIEILARLVARPTTFVGMADELGLGYCTKGLSSSQIKTLNEETSVLLALAGCDLTGKTANLSKGFELSAKFLGEYGIPGWQKVFELGNSAVNSASRLMTSIMGASPKSSKSATLRP